MAGVPQAQLLPTLLAREGFDVTLVEREVFPRYHIGKSLLPSCLEILNMTGAREKIEAHGFQRKDGGYFAWGKDTWILNFEKLRHPYSFQVIRFGIRPLAVRAREKPGSEGLRRNDNWSVSSMEIDHAALHGLRVLMVKLER